MIVSASRRTDIPALFSEWFYNRVEKGFVLLKNPYNPLQVGRVTLTPDKVDGFVFWTKNAAPMLPRINELDNFKYYFQFTITPYGKDVEKNIPDKKKLSFRRLRESKREKLFGGTIQFSLTKNILGIIMFVPLLKLLNLSKAILPKL